MKIIAPHENIFIQFMTFWGGGAYWRGGRAYLFIQETRYRDYLFEL